MSTNMGMTTWCVDGFAARMREGLASVLDQYAEPTRTSPDYTVAFEVEQIGLNVDDDDWDFTWQLTIRDRSSRTIVQLESRSSTGPTDVDMRAPRPEQQAILTTLMRNALDQIRAALNGSVLAFPSPNCSTRPS